MSEEDFEERFWETTPLDKMTRTQWEALCDGCGKCCMHKLQDADTGEIENTDIACKLLDVKTVRCTDYRMRHKFVPECMRLTARNVRSIEWLPKTCAYRLIAAGEPLPTWHYLVCGDREEVHRAGISVKGWAIPEAEAGNPEHHIIDREF